MWLIYCDLGARCLNRCHVTWLLWDSLLSEWNGPALNLPTSIFIGPMQHYNTRTWRHGRFSLLRPLSVLHPAGSCATQTLSRAATASWVPDLTSSPLTDRIWSPCISLPSASTKPPFTISDTNTPVSFLVRTQGRRDRERTIYQPVKMAAHPDPGSALPPYCAINYINKMKFIAFLSMLDMIHYRSTVAVEKIFHWTDT